MKDAKRTRRILLEEELKRMVEVLVRERRPKLIILFGSMARCEAHEWSDIDLAVVLDTDKRLYDRIGDLIELCDPRVAAEFIVYTPAEFEAMVASEPFVRKEIVGRGRILYEAA